MLQSTKINFFIALFLFHLFVIFFVFHKYLNGNNGPKAVKPRHRESALAHKLLDGLWGIEIGASVQNPFGLRALNVDYSDDPNAFYQQHQTEIEVHVLAPGDNLPFTNNSVDFVVSAHVLEHFWDPIKTIKEWLRVVKPGGFVYMDVPHKERTMENNLPRTPLTELLERHEGKRKPTNPAEELKPERHKSVWITSDLLELCRHFNWNVVEWRDVDDKDGIKRKQNGWPVFPLLVAGDSLTLEGKLRDDAKFLNIELLHDSPVSNPYFGNVVLQIVFNLEQGQMFLNTFTSKFHGDFHNISAFVLNRTQGIFCAAQLRSLDVPLVAEIPEQRMLQSRDYITINGTITKNRPQIIILLLNEALESYNSVAPSVIYHLLNGTSNMVGTIVVRAIFTTDLDGNVTIHFSYNEEVEEHHLKSALTEGQNFHLKITMRKRPMFHLEGFGKFMFGIETIPMWAIQYIRIEGDLKLHEQPRIEFFEKKGHHK
ncbi:hypothetical protein niasHS_008152 [Heterodera schachtii]|uniref:Methyltransferase type 11 domain-containing protein n=1 Tax=Heterodera schachtii TaxID=97005 RepID=A0ABD2J010_HETSC